MLIDWLQHEGWYVVYKDLPNASRSGFGLQGKVALTFEHILDRAPDIVAIKKEKILLVEVDTHFSNASSKMDEYRANGTEISKMIAGLLKNKQGQKAPSKSTLQLWFCYFSKSRSKIEWDLIKQYASVVDKFLYIRIRNNKTQIKDVSPR